MKHFDFAVNATTALALGFSVLAFCSVTSYGEGGDKRPINPNGTTGDHGINRRVITTPGYIEAGGSFKVDFGLPVDINGNEIAGIADNRPSVYVGGNGTAATATGGTYEVDAGLQYDVGIGWNYFFRNSDKNTQGNNVAQYCQIEYWDKTLNQSRVWRSTAHQITDDLRFGVNSDGSVSVSVSAWPAGAQTAFWLGQSTVAPRPKKTMDYTTNPTAPIAAGDKEAVLGSVAGFETLEPLQVGGETVRIAQIVGNKVILGKDGAGNQLVFQAAHPITDVVKQTVKFYVAYPDHPAAPWRGQEVVSFAAHDSRVKRVVAMTRRVPAGVAEDVLDGSWLTCLFSQGNVRMFNEAATGHDRGKDDIEQLGDRFTGFDVPKNGAPNNGAWDKIWQGHKTADSRTKVEFSNLNTPAPLVASGKDANIIARYGDDGNHDQRVSSYGATSGANSRYKEENVVINLGVVTHLLGESLK